MLSDISKWTEQDPWNCRLLTRIMFCALSHSQTQSENVGAQLYPGHEIQAVNLALNLLPLSECYLCAQTKGMYLLGQ